MANEDLLKNWDTLNENIESLTEDECKELLDTEREGERRFSFMNRIFGRYNKLRCDRERRELISGGAA